MQLFYWLCRFRLNSHFCTEHSGSIFKCFCLDTLQTSPFLLDISHSSVLEDFREAFDSNSVETLEDINLRGNFLLG